MYSIVDGQPEQKWAHSIDYWYCSFIWYDHYIVYCVGVSSYHGNKSSGSWKYTSRIFIVFWKKLFSSTWSSIKKLAGALLPKDLSVSMKHIWSCVFTFSVLALSLVVALELQRATFQSSLLARCGDIEPNPGPLPREGDMNYGAYQTLLYSNVTDTISFI